jgi:hypothetical protein
MKIYRIYGNDEATRCQWVEGKTIKEVLNEARREGYLEDVKEIAIIKILVEKSGCETWIDSRIKRKPLRAEIEE